MGSGLHIELLGGFRLDYQGEQRSTVMTHRLQELLTWLVLNRDKPQSRQHLAFLFWPDSNEKQAKTNLRNLLYQFRKALPAVDRYVVTNRKTLQWNPEGRFTLDVAEFEEAVERFANDKDDASRIRMLKAAVEIYRGPLLPECYASWIEQPRAHLQQEYRHCLQELTSLLEKHREYESAVPYTRKWIQSDPYNEPAWRKLMELHTANDDRANALLTYKECAKLLQEELESKPSPETQQLYERLVHGPTDLTPSEELNVLTEEWQLVGRKQEWESFRGCWKQVLAGRMQALIIQGEPGIGKTRLGLEFLNTLQNQGYATAYSRCYEAAGTLSYGPVINWLKEESHQQQLQKLDSLWLTELVRVLPELLVEHPDLSLPGAITEPWQQRQLYEAIARGLAAGDKPRLLFIDDLQWCDRETLEWISYLFHNHPDEKLMLVGAFRPAEAAPNEHLQTLIQVLRRQERLQEFSLDALNEEETGELASSVAQTSIAEAAAKRLYRESEGHPLFVVEAVREGQWMEEVDSEGFSKDDISPAQPLPKKVNQVISARFRRLSDTVRQSMDVAAVLGREFTLDILRQVSELNEPDLIEALEELTNQHIIRPQGSGEYDFTHDKLREVAYEELSEARRQWLHKRVARAIEEVYAGNLHVYNGRLAWHYDRAGMADKAVECYNQAAQEARTLLADLEEVGYLNRSSGLLEQVPAEPSRTDGRSKKPTFITQRLTFFSGIVVMLLILFVAGQRYLFTGPAREIDTIAVLPFRNLSAEGPHDYLADGLHNEILTQLSKVGDLKVIGRTSVMGYAGPDTPPISQIASDLGVGSVVEGSVQVTGERLRVHVQLVEPATEVQLWAERYDRTLDDAFVVQSEVAQQITAALGAALSGAEREQLTQAPTTNTEAYLLYLQGREYWHRPAYLRQNFEIARQLFEQALALDPDFALARAALAHVHVDIYWFGYDRSPDRVKIAREHVEEALRLAPNLPQAHIAMGRLYYSGYNEYKHALNEFKIALEALPNDARLWELIGYVHRRQGNWDKALAMYEKAVQLNPRNADLIMDLGGWTLRCVGRYAEAVRAFDRALTLAPDYHLVAVSKGMVYMHWKGILDTLRTVLTRLPEDTELGMNFGTPLDLRIELLRIERRPDSLLQIAPDNNFIDIATAHQMRGDWPAARAAFKSALAGLDSVIKERPDDWTVHASRGLALAGLGRDNEALAEARWLQHSVEYRRDVINRLNIVRILAPILAMAGKSELALSEIERMLSEPCSISVHELRLEPRWDPIRDHPGFKALLTKYGGS